MTQEQIKDYNLRITQANASGLVVIIYELLLDTLEETLEMLHEHSIEEYRHGVKKSSRYLGELIHGVNVQDPIGRQLVKHYVLLQRQLVKADIRLDEHLISQVMKDVKSLQPHFIRIAQEDREEPIMGNAQKVYAGLTYGRDCLNETALDPSNNRGYSV